MRGHSLFHPSSIEILKEGETSISITISFWIILIRCQIFVVKSKHLFFGYWFSMPFLKPVYIKSALVFNHYNKKISPLG